MTEGSTAGSNGRTEAEIEAIAKASVVELSAQGFLLR
jgi:hypothetical protein